ncbi:50S ribosomal protein L4 [Gammaproteobacteria bacterium]|nr:50S ribosomal protein L4 [Gammaproteobacteria bacterium]
MKINLHDNAKETIECSDQVFSQEPNNHVINKVITIYNKKRVSTAANKGRSEVSFSGKKPWKQKGLGKARAGTRASPIWRKGGVTFAKASVDRTKSFKINKKEYRKAIMVMFSDHFRSGSVKVISDLKVESTKTKDFKSLMSNYGFSKAGKPNNWTGLIISESITEDVFLSSCNLYEYMMCNVQGIDPLTLKHASELLITKSALQKIEEWLS